MTRWLIVCPAHGQQNDDRHIYNIVLNQIFLFHIISNIVLIDSDTTVETVAWQERLAITYNL